LSTVDYLRAQTQKKKVTEIWGLKRVWGGEGGLGR